MMISDFTKVCTTWFGIKKLSEKIMNKFIKFIYFPIVHTVDTWRMAEKSWSRILWGKWVFEEY